jgi:hypothetical protein
MSKSSLLPDLSFTDIIRDNRKTDWDLRYLLYKGGAKSHSSYVNKLIDSGQLGNPISCRFDLVIKLHQSIHDKLASGGSAFTADNNIRFIRGMFQWAEEANMELKLTNIQNVYLSWADHLFESTRIPRNGKKYGRNSAYTVASHVSYILDPILQRPNPLISMTRLRPGGVKKKKTTAASEKINLSKTFSFGNFLQDICDALTIETVLRSSLPVRITIRSGGELIEPSGNVATTTEGKLKYESEGTLKTRYPLANRRCEAELLMFIAQTGMNYSQAVSLKLRNFSYASYLDGYIVRERKSRRGGDVIFEIYKDYKPHFERYLEWRRTLFPESDLLFPFLQIDGKTPQKNPQFALRYKSKSLGLTFIPPQKLRNTRVNWLLKRSGDPDITSEMAQHTKQTLLRVYEQPSQHRAITEITKFWSKFDPTLSRTTPPAPGVCFGTAQPISSPESNLPNPDCIRPSGCLWCEHHRDLDNQDYVWALASFRHLKIIELSKWNPAENNREIHPAQRVINRITDKLLWFKSSNRLRNKWMEEAIARVEEGNYHPDWIRNIASLEGPV